MNHFWRFARRMLRRPWTLALAVAMAFVSAAGLGAGLVTLAPVLRNILGERAETLPTLAARLEASWKVDLPDAWVDALPPGRFDAVLWLVAILAVLTVIGAVANFLHTYLAMTVSVRTVADIRRDAFRHTLHMPLRSVIGRSSELTSRLLTDSDMLLVGFNGLASKTLGHVFKGAAAVVAALIVDWRLTLAALLIAPLLFVVLRKLSKRVRRATRGALAARARLLMAATESFQGLRVVKVHTNERGELGRFSRHNEEAVRETLRARWARSTATPLVETITVFVLGGLALLAAKAIIDGQLPAEDFIVGLAALGVAGASLKPLTGLVQDMHASGAAAKRLSEILDAPLEPQWTLGRRRTLPRLPRHAESIEFERVTFSYETAAAPAVRDVSLRIEHGETVAFVGPNGSGKTTLLSLVPRLFNPEHGRILIDGVDTAGVDLRSLRKQIGVVTQEVVLFEGTVRANIAYGMAGASDDDVARAAEQARAAGFIAELPGGYDAPLGEQGMSLSGGQRQRLAIARAVLRDPAILILDEATSMIDADSERQIADAIAEFSIGRTCLIVAHRLSTVMNADRIVVMDAGRVVDVGGHADLLDRCPTYRLIASHQLAPAGA